MIRLSDIPLRGHESRVARCFLLLLVPLLCAGTAFGGDACRNEAAEKAFQEGFRLQKRMESQAALAAYRRCLSIEPTCLACRYELGWSLWQLGRWREVVEVWEGILAEVPDHPEVRAFLPQAREHLAGKGQANTVRHPPIGTPSQPATAPIHLELIARFQNYDAAPADPRDHFDPDIASPKSAIFTPDGRKVYVNSLEGMKTVVYDAKRLVKRKVIRHTFGRESARYFREDTFFGRPLGGDRGPKNPNHFSGKPVEAALSHGGRFLWVPYYRRSYDPKGIAPSAVAIIDTERDEIVRVIATGPISKCVAPSPDGRFMAISHWGDNTLTLLDISGEDPMAFHYVARLVVERELDLSRVSGNRDQHCGFCLRGMAYDKEGRHLFVARMGGGGIAIFDLMASPPRYLGSVFGMKPTPRDLLVTRDGRWLYMSCNRSGYIARVPTETLLRAIGENTRPTLDAAAFDEVYVGPAARTIRFSPDERFLFVAVNRKSEIAVLEAATMKVITRVPVNSFPVGLALSPDGKRLWVTSQGRHGLGGNAVCVFAVRSPEGRTTRSAGDPPG